MNRRLVIVAIGIVTVAIAIAAAAIWFVLAGVNPPAGSRGPTPVTATPPAVTGSIDSVTAWGPVPGAADPRVSQDNLASTICRAGYATSVRPPQKVTAKIKRDLIKVLPRDADHDASHYQLDHAISLEVGGQPLALKADGSVASYQPNLWLQPVDEAHVKDDQVEDRLHALVCAGRMTLREAQDCEWPAWRACIQTIKQRGG